LFSNFKDIEIKFGVSSVK